MRVVFMGTPDAAVPSLRALVDAFDVAGVYTRPDRPRGRGRRVEASPIKQAATELGLQVRQPRRLRDDTDALRAIAPDAIAVVAYGALLRPDVLQIPVLGCVNVHFSLLPRWRGAAPVERAVLAGDVRTGVTTMLMDEGLDTGPILLQETTEIAADDTSGSLRMRLASMGAPLLVQTLRGLEASRIEPRPQPDEGVTIAGKILPYEAELDLTEDATTLERKIRGFDPVPGAFVWFRDKRLKIWRGAVEGGEGEPGTFVDGTIQTADGRLRLVEVQPEGKRRMSGQDLVRGYRPADGERVTSRRG
jgi:methionyl-tRNA formyltransferase